jgi:excisionase family DNA binding protein
MDSTNSIESPYLTIDEAAAFLKVHPNTIRGWLKDGKLTELRAEAADGIRLFKNEVQNFFRPKPAS